MSDITKNFIDQIEANGFKAGIISIKHMGEIQSDMEAAMKNYKDVSTHIGKYLSGFGYDYRDELPDAKSIIVIAMPQPMSRIYFTLGAKKRAVIMPPMYLLNSSVEGEKQHKKICEVTSTIENILLEKSFKMRKINLPCKLVASRSGLGSYGKNNVCYVNNESSFYWMGVYISDLPCEEDSWQEAEIMKACTNCDLCGRNCPTGAIANDRFLVYASKCVTLQNESTEDFPEWLNSKCHNSIIGCMRCQIICPVNRNNIKGIEDLGEFDEVETKMILDKTPLHELPDITYRKIELINFTEYYELLARNLNALIGKYR